MMMFVFFSGDESHDFGLSHLGCITQWIRLLKSDKSRHYSHHLRGLFEYGVQRLECKSKKVPQRQHNQRSLKPKIF